MTEPDYFVSYDVALAGSMMCVVADGVHIVKRGAITYPMHEMPDNILKPFLDTPAYVPCEGPSDCPPGCAG
jgi:hypothetical protein